MDRYENSFAYRNGKCYVCSADMQIALLRRWVSTGCGTNNQMGEFGYYVPRIESGSKYRWLGAIL